MAKSRRRRRVSGVVPKFFTAVGRGMRWVWDHPQPVMAIAVVAAGVGAGWYAVGRSEAFRVTRVTFTPADVTFDVPKTVIGQRLWTVDVEGLARALQAQRPSLKRVRVVRLAPDTLQIDSVVRAPVAQVRLSGWHPVDADGYVLPEGRATPHERLVMLKGVDSTAAPLKAGHQQAGEPMARALRLLARLTRSPELAGHRLVSVDAGDPDQLSFVIDENVEVRCGGEADLAAHLDRLRAVLKQVASHALSVRYIDVRFRDPVIAPRTS